MLVRNEDLTALELIDMLIGGWNNWDSNEDYYLNELAPAIVRGTRTVHLTSDEKELLSHLRRRLSAGEWARLPKLISERRTGQLRRLSPTVSAPMTVAGWKQNGSERSVKRQRPVLSEKQDI